MDNKLERTFFQYVREKMFRCLFSEFVVKNMVWIKNMLLISLT
jgi:hypothetical protein